MRRALAALVALSAACSSGSSKPVAAPELSLPAAVSATGALNSGLAITTRIEKVDGRPFNTRTLAPGERVILAHVDFVKAESLKDAALKRSEAYYCEFPLRATLKPGGSYLVKGEIKSKFCLAWIEDAQSGAKASFVESTFYVKQRSQGDSSLALSTVEAALRLLGVSVR